MPGDFNCQRHDDLGARLRCGTEGGDKRKLVEILTSVGVEGERPESEKTASTVRARRRVGGVVSATSRGPPAASGVATGCANRATAYSVTRPASVSLTPVVPMSDHMSNSHRPLASCSGVVCPSTYILG
jgi:hypothetical protein